ncbi:MAG: two-component system, chemotaxis family, CheB/CheR fusion protein, partial [Gaiellales bacterium]|nr:two-component system, chemotaxis family, CheB/CheR fusion protein [Gaiellales bacterium]
MTIIEQTAEFEQLLEHLRESRGFDFTGYKRASLMRRTTKRMHEVGVESYADYLLYLHANPAEFEALFDTILINVTSFFRDPETWDVLAADIVPQAIERSRGHVRIWSAGCATGQEAFSAAMLFANALGTTNIASQVKIYATDVDQPALAQARLAEYDAKALEPVREQWRDAYFEQQGSRFGVRKDIRRAVIFGRHNLCTDAPISRIDLLLCRNTLMYLNPPLQSRILDSLHFALKPEGTLCLGKSEVMMTRSDRFEPVNLKRRIFRPRPGLRRYDRRLPMSYEPTSEEMSAIPLESRAFETATVPQLVLDKERRVVVANRRAREQFGVSDDDIGRTIQDIELSYRPADLRSMIDQADTARQPVALRGVEWRRGDETSFWDVSVAPLINRQDATVGMLVAFVDVSRHHGLEDQLSRSQLEVQAAYEELQSTVEELETTNEELQSTNEELETTNEELQSTNEELETMNEELQSLNDELHASNEELRLRTLEVGEVNAFMESVLAGLGAAVLVVDADQRVLVWNRQAEELWGVRREEAVGQHLLTLDIGLPLERLRPLVRAALDGTAGDGVRPDG